MRAERAERALRETDSVGGERGSVGGALALPCASSGGVKAGEGEMAREQRGANERHEEEVGNVCERGRL